MSLIVNEGSASTIPLLPEDVYPAVCSMLVDLGDQYSKQFNKTSRKVLICWEIPSETLDNGEPRRMSKTYTATLNSKGTLRADLIAWRGRDFTPDELKAFDLANVAGAPCMLQVVHKAKSDGSKYAAIAAIIKLPKGMARPALSSAPLVFDLDKAEEAEKKIHDLPEWVQERIRESDTWKDILLEADYKQAEGEKNEYEDTSAATEETDFREIDDDETGLPF